MGGVVSGRQIVAQHEQGIRYFSTWWANMVNNTMSRMLTDGTIVGAIYGGQPPKREVDYFIERHGRIN